MSYLFVTPLRIYAITVLTFAALAFNACSNDSVSTEPAMRSLAPLSRSVVPQTSNGLKYFTVDDTKYNSGQYEVTGINHAREIVGDYAQSVTTGGTVWQAFTAPYAGNTTDPYPVSSFVPVDWPEDPQGTYLAGISTAGNSPVIEVGYVEAGTDVRGELGPGVWGVVNNQGLWSAIPKPGNGCADPSNNVVEVLAFDGNTTAVGFHSNGSCINVPFEITNGDTTSQTRFSSFTWMQNTEATGIDSSDDIVGTTQVNSAKGKPAGWYLKSSSQSMPPPVRCCSTAGTFATSFTGIATVQSVNWIAGWYTDGNGTHGLLYNPSGSGTKAWTTIDEPKASGFTVVNGINDKGDICGWYKDASGVTHGFVGLKVGAAHAHRRNYAKG